MQDAVPAPGLAEILGTRRLESQSSSGDSAVTFGVPDRIMVTIAEFESEYLGMTI